MWTMERTQVSSLTPQKQISGYQTFAIYKPVRIIKNPKFNSPNIYIYTGKKLVIIYIVVAGTTTACAATTGPIRPRLLAKTDVSLR